MELRGVGARGNAAVAGIDGVDEHKVSYVYERILVIDQPVGRRRLEAILGHLDMFGSKRTHVQPYRGSARTAVVEERNRPRFHVLPVPGVGHEEHPRRNLSVVEPDRQRAGSGTVLDLAAIEPNRVRALRDLLFRYGRHFIARRRLAARLISRRCRLLRGRSAGFATALGVDWNQRQQEE